MLKIVNYSKENKLVPAIVKVGVSYLNNPRQVASILVKVGKRGMKEIVDVKGRNLVRQNRMSIFLTKTNLAVVVIRNFMWRSHNPLSDLTNLMTHHLIFSMWLYVRDYGAQFKTKTDLRMIMYEEFKKYDIRIPWPIRTIYQGDEKKEFEEISKLDQDRDQVIDKFWTWRYWTWRRRRIVSFFSKLKNPI